ncbi:hypothetical protein ON010_g16724 [Phytophthora cinnamomi]|nr:hypothetical protein ON010_g16724 [Phytophthora cinnamomi]
MLVQAQLEAAYNVTSVRLGSALSFESQFSVEPLYMYQQVVRLCPCHSWTPSLSSSSPPGTSGSLSNSPPGAQAAHPTQLLDFASRQGYPDQAQVVVVMVELYTQTVPDTSGGAKVNAGDILIIVAVLVFTMVVAVVASIQAGESHLAKYFPCVKRAKRDEGQALESPGDAYLVSETPGKKLPGGDERGSTISKQRPSASLIARDGPEQQVNEMSNFFLADRGMQCTSLVWLVTVLVVALLWPCTNGMPPF